MVCTLIFRPEGQFSNTENGFMEAWVSGPFWQQSDTRRGGGGGLSFTGTMLQARISGNFSWYVLGRGEPDIRDSCCVEDNVGLQSSPARSSIFFDLHCLRLARRTAQRKARYTLLARPTHHAHRHWARQKKNSGAGLGHRGMGTNTRPFIILGNAEHSGASLSETLSDVPIGSIAYNGEQKLNAVQTSDVKFARVLVILVMYTRRWPTHGAHTLTMHRYSAL